MTTMSAEYHRKWYKANRDKRILQIKAHQKRIADWFREFKRTLSCSRCDESDPVCLDFHHRDPREKDMEIALAAHHSWSKERILAEIAKCDVLCSNCHRKLHRLDSSTV